MSRLFDDDAPNYASASFPPPRPFQSDAHERLRQGVRDGHRCQMLMSSTGSGKTYLGLRVIHEALKKGKRAIFVCDRRSLIEQTSAVADSYGLSAHGIMMANHNRYDPSMPFQIASAQTLARRQWPDADVIVIDEAHTQLKVWTEHIQTTEAAVIGLSATPFSTGLGKLFSNLVNATSMHHLTESGVLVPMRVFSCAKVDMRGAETSGGEWTDRAAQDRGMAIVGDVVTEWAKFARDRKTIVFGATIAHCEEMARQFNDAGVMAACFTSDTDQSEREMLLTEYRKPDSALRVLISVEALAKGFDVPDVSCLAQGSNILTDRGNVAIEQLLLSDKIWDGCDFVSHGGTIYRGYKNVITYAGLTATPNHLVQTASGWIPFGKCAREGAAIRKTGIGRNPVRMSENCFSDSYFNSHAERHKNNGHVPVLSLWSNKRSLLWPRQISSFLLQLLEDFTPNGKRQKNSGKGSPSKQEGCYAYSGMVENTGKRNAGTVRKSIAQTLQELRWTWDRISIRFCKFLCKMGFGQPWRLSIEGVGQDRQQRPLRAWKSSMGIQEPERMQQQARRMDGDGPQVQDGASGDSIRRQNTSQFDKPWFRSEVNHRQVLPEVGQAKRHVWDILNAGPRNRFTCEGLLVHNCVCDVRPLRKSLSTAIQMWGRGLRSSPNTGKTDCYLLDFSGNIIRFADDFSDIFYNGLAELDCGEKLDKAIRRDDEEKPEGKACPQCGYQPCGKRCVSCGFEHQRRAEVEHEAGEMREVMIGKTKYADDKRHLWEQCVTYARGRSAPDKQRGRASNIYRDITGEWPSGAWGFDSTPNVAITKPVLNKIRQKNMAFAAVHRKLAA